MEGLSRHVLAPVPAQVGRPARWPSVVGGPLVGAVSLPLLAPFVGLGVLVASAGTVLAWTVITALHESAVGVAESSAVARTIRLRRRAGVLALFLAAAAIVGLLSLAEVRVALPVLALVAGACAAVELVQARRAAPPRTVLVGSHHEIEAYAARLDDRSKVLVVGTCLISDDRTISFSPPLSVPTVRSLDHIEQLTVETAADEVVVVPGRSVCADDVRSLAWRFDKEPVTVSVAAPVRSVAQHRMHARALGNEVVLDLAVPRPGRAHVLGKSLLDRVVALFLLVLALPVLAVTWAAVRLDSRGPGFFVQTRVGRDGVPFRMVKLRTMYVDAEQRRAELTEQNEVDGALFKMRRDPRITRVGHLLRRSSLDELPQLWNVLRGEMSLVGPRPALPSEVATYTGSERRRLVVQPGITGLWQVSGRSDLSWEESVRLDLYYADNWRVVDDLTIAARTVVAVTAARGAY